MFNMDSWLWRILSRIADIAILSILFLVCSIPVFTVGASLTALYTVSLKLSKREEGYIVRDFLRAFKENFRQGTAIWLILLTAGVILGTDIYLLRGNRTLIGMLMNLVFYIMAFIYVMVLSYIFPLQSKFVNKVRDTFKNAVTVGIANLLPWTLLLMAMNLIPLLLFLLPLKLILYMLPLLVGFLFGGIAYINSKMLNHVFEKYISKIENESQTGKGQRDEEI